MKVIFGTDAIKYPLTGIGRYAFELANKLAASPDISELLFLRGGSISDQIPVAKETSSSTEGLKQYIKKVALLQKHTVLLHHG